MTEISKVEDVWKLIQTFLDTECNGVLKIKIDEYKAKNDVPICGCIKCINNTPQSHCSHSIFFHIIGLGGDVFMNAENLASARTVFDQLSLRLLRDKTDELLNRHIEEICFKVPYIYTFSDIQAGSKGGTNMALADLAAFDFFHGVILVNFERTENHTPKESFWRMIVPRLVQEERTQLESIVTPNIQEQIVIL